MGGAWKVAYADLVTGLFALFMCLWLTSVDEDTMEEISEYFKNPNTETVQASPGTIDIKNANVAASRKASFSKPALVPKRLIRKTTENIEKSFVQSPEIKENENMHVEVIDEGIKLSLFSTPKRDFFRGGNRSNENRDLSDYGTVVVDSLGSWLSRKFDKRGDPVEEMEIEIEGHATAGVGKENPWVESINQANMIREKLIQNGVNPDYIKKIVGYGDRHSQEPGKTNRVSLVIRNKK